MTTETTRKTAQEIKKLKEEWLLDPSWDIWETPGFESHREELRAFQSAVDADDTEPYQNRLRIKSAELGVLGNLKLAEHVLNLEYRISHLYKMVEKLQSR